MTSPSAQKAAAQPGYYSKLPVVIKAMQFAMIGKSGKSNYPEVVEWITSNGTKCFVREPHQIIIETLEGNMIADVGDWIICGIKGEFYPCKPDVFAKSYREERGYPYDRQEHTQAATKSAITEAVDAAVASKEKRVKELEEHVRTLCECLKSDPEMAFDYTHQIAQAEKALEAPHEP